MTNPKANASAMERAAALADEIDSLKSEVTLTEAIDAALEHLIVEGSAAPRKALHLAHRLMPDDAPAKALLAAYLNSHNQVVRALTAQRVRAEAGK